LCRLNGIFNLTEDLRFAQHHAVQAAGNAEGVADGVAAAVGVKVGADFFRR
jgi:hypothetical protein